MFNFNVKDGSLPGGQFYLNVPVSMPEMYVFRSIADVRCPMRCKHRHEAPIWHGCLQCLTPLKCAAVCDPPATGR